MQEINDLLKHCLEKDGYRCTQAFSGSEARLVLNQQHFDLILLDLMLPGISGNQILIETKAKMDVPIIVISTKDHIETRVEVLEAGGGDYICKSFEIEEVLARVHVQLRKANTSSQKRIHLGYIELDPITFQVSISGNEIALTKHEFLLLKLLMEAPKQVFTKQMIYENVWQEEYLGDECIISTHLGNLRAKLRIYSETEYIQTVWGIGFKFV